MDKVAEFEAALLSYMRTENADFMSEVTKTGAYNDESSRRCARRSRSSKRPRRSRGSGDGCGKEVRKKIKSVKSTQKITKAMQMVAASKMRRTQERMRQGRPYAEKIRKVIGHLANSNPEYRHVYMTERKSNAWATSSYRQTKVCAVAST